MRAVQPDRSVLSVVALRIAWGVSAGAASVSILTLLDALTVRSTPVPALPEILLLTLLGSVPKFTFGAYFSLFANYRYLLFLPLGFLLIWPRTRRVSWAVLGAAVFLVAAWIAALACATAYALDRSTVLLPGMVAVPVTALLCAWRRWRLASTLLLCSGLALGTLFAQAFYAFPFQDDYPRLVHPIWGFAPPVATSLIALLLLTWVRRPRPSGAWLRNAVCQWGLMTCGIASAMAFGAEWRGMREREPDPPGARFLDDWAYDVHVTGDPPQLVWTDRRKIHVLTDPYGDRHERYTVDDDEAYYVERIWSSPTGGFYIQGDRKLDWWQTPAPGSRLSYRPAARYRFPEWLNADSSTTWTIGEDPMTRRLFTVGEYYSRYAVIDRDSGDLVGHGNISNALWPFWHFTASPDNRALYMTSALDDGALYEMNLDTLAVQRKARHLYVYKAALDAQQDLLWGIRPLTGEVVAIDTRTYQMRHRVPVQFGLRDLQRDPDSGDIYACSEIFGDVFRVDSRTLAVARVGWCGRLCRGLFVDSARHTLWVATRDGICRIPIRAASPTGEAVSAAAAHGIVN